MLDSFQIAAALVQRGFDLITDPARTKAHGYVHRQMLHPLYVKILGAKGALQAATCFPLVIHREDAINIEAACHAPDCFTFDVKPYHSAGLLQYPKNSKNTPSGRALSIHDLDSLDKFLSIWINNGVVGASQIRPETALPDSWEVRATAAEIDADSQCQGVAPTTRIALINARLGQGNYRQRMMSIWGNRCAVTGCGVLEALIASHSQAWAHASNEARLDPYNGFLLIATLDRLFDQGLISFADDGVLLRKPSLTAQDLQTLGIIEDMRLRFVRPEHIPYLAEHRRVFDF